jgi:hypothetical protein
VLVRRGAIKTTRKTIDLDEEIEALTRKSEQAQQKAARKARYTAIMRAIHAHTAPAKVLTDTELLREWLKNEIGDADQDDTLTILNLPPVEDEDHEAMTQRAVARIDRADHVEIRRYMLATMLIRGLWGWYSEAAWAPVLRAATRALGVDLDAVDAEATAAEKAELDQAIANLRAAAKAQAEADKPAAPEGTLTPPPAAQASPTRAKAKKSTAPAALARDAARVKTTAAEAQAQIAAELRALEEANQAPAAQGDEAPPAARALAAASALPLASATCATPAPAQPSAPAADPAQAAACAAAPSGQARAGVDTGAAEQVVGIGARVRVNETATGKQQKPWIGYEGNVVAQIGPHAWGVAIERSKRCAPKQVGFDVTELEVVA